MSESSLPSPSAHDEGVEETKENPPPVNDNNSNDNVPSEDMDLGTPPLLEAPSESTSAVVDLSLTTLRIQIIVDRQLDLMLARKIPKISAQTEMLMDRLVSITSSVSGSGSVNPAPSVPSPVTPLPFAQVAAIPPTAVLTASDVRRLPLLDGSPDVDVASVLAQFRLVAA